MVQRINVEIQPSPSAAWLVVWCSPPPSFTLVLVLLCVRVIITKYESDAINLYEVHVAPPATHVMLPSSGLRPVRENRGEHKKKKKKGFTGAGGACIFFTLATVTVLFTYMYDCTLAQKSRKMYCLPSVSFLSASCGAAGAKSEND